MQQTHMGGFFFPWKMGAPDELSIKLIENYAVLHCPLCESLLQDMTGN